MKIKLANDEYSLYRKTSEGLIPYTVIEVVRPYTLTCIQNTSCEYEIKDSKGNRVILVQKGNSTQKVVLTKGTYSVNYIGTLPDGTVVGTFDVSY